LHEELKINIKLIEDKWSIIYLKKYWMNNQNYQSFNISRSNSTLKTINNQLSINHQAKNILTKSFFYLFLHINLKENQQTTKIV